MSRVCHIVFFYFHFSVPVGSGETPPLNFPLGSQFFCALRARIFPNAYQYKLICYCTVARRRRKFFGFSHPFYVFPLIFALISWQFTSVYLNFPGEGGFAPSQLSCERPSVPVDPATPATEKKTIRELSDGPARAVGNQILLVKNVLVVVFYSVFHNY